MILVHFPIAGCVFAVALLVGARLWGGPAVNRLAMLALILVAASAVPAAITGGPSQEQLQPIPADMQHIIDQHAMISLYATWALQAAAVLAMVCLMYLYRRGRLPGLLWSATLSVLLLAGYLMAWTGSLGGEVVHLEIRGHQILPVPEL